MRRLLRILFFLSLGASGSLTLFASDHNVAPTSRTIALVLLVLVVLDKLFGWFRPSRRTRTPPSQIAEIERLYFRSMRELLNDELNVIQVVNDLQRILLIDPYYKNARHYLSRALILQEQMKNTDASADKSRNSAEFRRLQDQLIDPNPMVRRSVVMEFIQYGEDAIDPLIALLMDEDADVRITAATALGWVGGKDAVQPLLVALQDENSFVRRYAARAMCWVVNDEALEGLIASLRDEDSYVRSYCARAIGWSQNRRAVRPLLERLVEEENADVREYVFTALEDLGETDTRPERPMKANA